MPEKERQRLALDFAKEIVERHQVAADVAIHEPSRGGDNRNHHAHILITTRQLTESGFTKKTRELDDRKSGEVDYWRKRYADLQNKFFKQNGIDETVDHRTLKAQGIDREPTQHLGVAATNYERRTGKKSNKRLNFEQQAAEQLKVETEINALEHESRQAEQFIDDIANNAKAQVKELKAEQIKIGYEEFKRKQKTAEKTAMEYEAFKQGQAEQERQKASQQQTKPKKNKDHDLEM